MNTRREEGSTLVVLILVISLLLAIMLSITATLAISASRNTKDQTAVQQAQATAESGIAFISAKIVQNKDLLKTIQIPQTTSLSEITELLKLYCGTSILNTPPSVIISPFVLCTANASVSDANRLNILQNYITSTSATPAYWATLFGLGNALTTGNIDVAGKTTSYSTNFRFMPTKVVQTGQSSFQVWFRIAEFTSTGKITKDSVNTAKRVVNIQASNEFYVNIQKPPFNAFAQFRNKTTSATGGGQLSFANGEEFRGPVHTNDPPGLSGNPVFYDQFTTASSTAVISGTPSGCSTVAQMATAGSCTTMFPGVLPKFSQPFIELPVNNNNQLRATIGGDASNSATVGNPELIAALGVTSVVSNTIYYSKGNGTIIPNTGPSFLGGLYINGDADIKFSRTTDARQIVQITQGIAITRFEKQSTGVWNVSVNGGAAKTVNGTFNGLIYSTGNLNLYGDGDNSTPDIASGAQFTVTNAGVGKNILIKDSMTYTDNPAVNPDATNVLGIYSSQGNVLLDGQDNKDLIVNASILATSANRGFGSVDAGRLRYTGSGNQPRIILTGGVIEDQSQTVSSFPGGYKRNYTYDGRFKTGFAPPYFPLQQRWTSDVDPTLFQFGLIRQSK